MLALFLYMTGPGLGGTSDSVHYLWAAHTLRETGHLLEPDGTPYRYWGPLYPVLLAGFFSFNGVRLMHGVALLGQLVLWTRMGRWLLPPSRVTGLPLLIALSTAVLVPAKFIWSEPVFGALAAAYFYALLAWSRNGRGSWLAVATVAGFILPLQRTSGLFLLVGAGVGLLLTGQWRRFWLPLLGHWAGCAAGGLAWNYYAEVVAGPPVYQAVKGWADLGSSMADYGFVLVRWFLPLAASWLAAWPRLWALALPTLLLLLLWPRHQRSSEKSAVEFSEAAPIASPTNQLRLLWWVVVVTLVALLAATNATRAAAGPHDAERYCAVLVGPVMILALASWPASTRTLWFWLGRVLLAGLLLYAAGRVVHNAHRLREYPPITWPENDFDRQRAVIPNHK